MKLAESLAKQYEAEDMERNRLDRFNPEQMTEEEQIAYIKQMQLSEKSAEEDKAVRLKEVEAMVLFRQQVQAPTNCLQIDFDVSGAALTHPNLFDKVHVHRLKDAQRKQEEDQLKQKDNNQQELLDFGPGEGEDEEDEQLLLD